MSASQIIRDAAKPYIRASLRQRFSRRGRLLKERDVAKLLLRLAKQVDDSKEGME